jgi:hypothetical protein
LGHSTPSTTLNVYAAFMPSADGLDADVVGNKLTALTDDACANQSESDKRTRMADA